MCVELYRSLTVKRNTKLIPILLLTFKSMSKKLFANYIAVNLIIYPNTNGIEFLVTYYRKMHLPV